MKKKIPAFKTDRAAVAFVDKADLSRYDLSGAQLVRFEIRRKGKSVYEYSRGFNWKAVIALALGAGTALSGLAIPNAHALYDYSWFVGFAVSFVAYYGMMRS
jgi:cytosine/uracil/thiamine/allantoin permease